MSGPAFRRRTCGCGQPFFWAVNALTGRAMPVDPEPAPNGSLLLLDERDNGRPIVRVLGKLERAGQPVLYVSHFQTCRDAASFRGTRRPA